MFNLAKMRECRLLALLQEALAVLGRRHACVVGPKNGHLKSRRPQAPFGSNEGCPHRHAAQHVDCGSVDNRLCAALPLCIQWDPYTPTSAPLSPLRPLI